MEAVGEPPAGGPPAGGGGARVQGSRGAPPPGAAAVVDPLSLSWLDDSLPAEQPGPPASWGQRWQGFRLASEAKEEAEEEGLEEEEEGGGGGGAGRAAAEARGYASDPDAPPDIDSAGAPAQGGCAALTQRFASAAAASPAASPAAVVTAAAQGRCHRAPAAAAPPLQALWET